MYDPGKRYPGVYTDYKRARVIDDGGVAVPYGKVKMLREANNKSMGEKIAFHKAMQDGKYPHYGLSIGERKTKCK